MLLTRRMGVQCEHPHVPTTICPRPITYISCWSSNCFLNTLHERHSLPEEHLVRQVGRMWRVHQRTWSGRLDQRLRSKVSTVKTWEMTLDQRGAKIHVLFSLYLPLSTPPVPRQAYSPYLLFLGPQNDFLAEEGNLQGQGLGEGTRAGNPWKMSGTKNQRKEEVLGQTRRGHLKNFGQALRIKEKHSCSSSRPEGPRIHLCGVGRGELPILVARIHSIRFPEVVLPELLLRGV